jgi:steroid delta-isomerase-like uncharacterized protein
MKRLLIIIMIFLLFFALGCQDKEVKTELEEMKAQEELEKQNKELAKQYIQTINEGNFEAFKEILSPDYEIYNPSGYPEPTSREKLIENYKGALQAFSDFNWSIEDMIASSDKVVVRIIVRGTYKGGNPEIPVPEKNFQFSLITILRIEKGLIVEEWQEDDQLGLARQLGMELKPRETEK